MVITSQDVKTNGNYHHLMQAYLMQLNFTVSQFFVQNMGQNVF